MLRQSRSQGELLAMALLVGGSHMGYRATAANGYRYLPKLWMALQRELKIIQSIRNKVA
ncbi:MAG: hypothetical protein KC643_20790 [Nitrospira sp.]|nr:hypothetical protein [Nitrospira sp.]